MSADLVLAVEEHCALFNECVRTGDWAPFLATFTEDARMSFPNAPSGPLVGRAAISGVYAKNLPREAMRIDAIEPVDKSRVRVSFHWESGGSGAMSVCWRDDRVAAVEIALVR